MLARAKLVGGVFAVVFCELCGSDGKTEQVAVSGIKRLHFSLSESGPSVFSLDFSVLRFVFANPFSARQLGCTNETCD